jgi:FixJ family two-component response regulator
MRPLLRRAGAPAATASAMTSSHIVFVIDDDAVVRDSMCALLESRNFNVTAFASGPEYLQQKSNADCLLLDIHMPEMTGLELLQALRQRGNPVPAILMTGRREAETQAKASALGVIDVLDKPVTHAALFAALQKALTPR